MIQIKRVASDEYELIGTNGEVISTYQQTKMEHPTDWREDAESAGYDITSPYDWEFVDERDDL